MSVSEKSTKQRVSLAERRLRQAGALPESCTEQVTRVCLDCGTIVADIAAWQSSGRRCDACDGTEFRAECVRCRGTCTDLSAGRRRPCASVAVFRATGQVAFPERAVEPPSAHGARPTPVAKPSVRPSPAGPAADALLSRAGWFLGAIVGTAAGLCRRWLDGLGIK